MTDLLGPFAVGDVLDHADGVQGLVFIVADQGDGEQPPGNGPVFSQAANRHLVVVAFLREQLLEPRGIRLQVFLVGEIGEVPAGHLLFVVTEHLLKRRITLNDDTHRVDHGDSDRGFLEEDPEPRLGFPQLLFHRLALADVADGVLQNFPVSDRVRAPDDLHGNAAPLPCIQRQVVIINMVLVPKFLEHDLDSIGVLKRLDLPEFTPHQFVTRIAGHGEEGGVDVDDIAGISLHQHDAVPRRVEQMAVALLAFARRRGASMPGGCALEFGGTPPEGPYLGDQLLFFLFDIVHVRFLILTKV